MYTQCTGIIKFCYINFEFIYSQFIFTEETLVYIFICFTCTKFFIYIWYRVMTTKTLFSICHHRIGCSRPITELVQPSLTPFPLVTSILLSPCVWFCLFCSLVYWLFILIFYIHMKSSVPVFLCLTYFTLYKTL